MMYRILMFVFAIGFFSCSTEDMQPQFKTVDNIDVTMAGKNMVNITADIHFYNPNVVGCTVEKVNLTAFAEGNEVSTIESNSKQEVPAKSEFVIPIKSSVALNKPAANPSDLLPSDSNSAWASLNPVGNSDLGNISLLNPTQVVGINTQGSSLRNANLQLRSEPTNPRTNTNCPWNISTIEEDKFRKPLEIGAGA